MNGTVNNGRRVDVVFGTKYVGRAGMVEREDGIEIAFPSDARRLRGVTSGIIDGAPYRVISIEDSKLVKGMVSLVVEAE